MSTAARRAYSVECIRYRLGERSARGVTRQVGGRAVDGSSVSQREGASRRWRDVTVDDVRGRGGDRMHRTAGPVASLMASGAKFSVGPRKHQLPLGSANHSYPSVVSPLIELRGRRIVKSAGRAKKTSTIPKGRAVGAEYWSGLANWLLLGPSWDLLCLFSHVCWG